ncbi:hypothetical protein [Streptomyces sp. SP18CS02]|uniref:hypothetical protein n=1 Tax=Streptomyces sp. SP18CS02 TaxID=3002531 RepID=UPI002E79CE16|nr:hypothetical protein [Streptomyces sp. SP18CS02]MEE1752911.1 hypothetical protein [Streptomyces sp. SP18CS02]
MHGQHARPTSSLFGRPGQDGAPPPGPGTAKHSRRSKGTGRLRRRILAYRAIDFLSSRVPGDSGPGEECLLLVHVRKVVGQVHYRICVDCAEAVITGVVIEERFLHTGLGTRALSHLRSRYPDMVWRSTMGLRTTRDLLRRMRIPTTTSEGLCPHMRQPHVASVPTAL